MTSERRQEQRAECFSSGELLFEGVAYTPCLIWNMSATGALIEVEPPSSPPDAFDLVVHADGVVRSCLVVRRTGRRLGVAFTI
ncbi:PilZ domain-containing protein [Methylobacterium durans]|uniref:Pilus assembly protein PilZ n=1 Tax=Methylobacterium durans TaxID=2202825 RepID=A0A2U8WCF7_9HYPH|nr:pilus assembly protein PilZ [Methylobacterium durans]